MQIELWGTEFRKRKNSTKIPTTPGVTKEVALKDHCTTMSPSFFVTGAVGYGYLKAWNNYYWITNIGFDINGHEYIDCQIDVLASWRTFIQSSIFYVERCSDVRYYNPDIKDTALSVEDLVEHHSQATTNVFFGVSTYVVRMLGRGTTGIQSFVSDGLSFWGDIFNPVFNTPGYVNLEDLITAYVSDPSKYVLGVYYTPFNNGRMIGTETGIYCGWYDTGKRAKALSSNAVYKDTITLNKPTGVYTDFRKTDNAFSHYTLFLPGIGTVPLSADIMDSELTLDLACDQHTGDIIYQLKAGGALVSSYNGNCYASLMVGNGDASNGGNIIKSTGEIITDIARHNAIETAKDVIDGLQQAISPTPSFIGSLTGVAGVEMKDAILSVFQKSSAEFPLQDYGRPCCKNLQLGLLTGFIKCGKASIDIASDLRIREEINDYLNTGFFME